MADSVIAYYGVRVLLTEQDCHQLERNVHPLAMRSEAIGLDTYWGNFAGHDELYYLFIGKEVGIVGLEHAWDRRVATMKCQR